MLGFLAAIAIGTNAVTFTATATGVETNTPIEFVFAANQSDRDYETLFLLDDSPDALAEACFKAGFPRGETFDARQCRLWPTGCRVSLDPDFKTLVRSEELDGEPFPELIFTGGEKGAAQPMAFLSLYDLSSAQVVFNGIFPQGEVYGHHFPRETIAKGVRKSFTLSWDGQTRTRPVEITVNASNMVENLTFLRKASADSEISVLVRFDGNLTLAQAVAAAQALATVDSPRVKINGRPDGDFFYRAFMPLVKWRDRQQRLTQPFEITVGEPPRLVFIAEDWSVEGLDPKLTAQDIPFADARKHPKTDTAFVFAHNDTKVSELHKLVKAMPKTVVNWYVYGE